MSDDKTLLNEIRAHWEDEKLQPLCEAAQGGMRGVVRFMSGRHQWKKKRTEGDARAPVDAEADHDRYQEENQGPEAA